MKFSEHYDVVVCGGGPAGIGAAVSSARQGAKTLLIERYGILGGTLTAGYVNPILGTAGPGTIRDEVIKLLEATYIETKNGKEMGIDTEISKQKLLEFVYGSGTDIMLQTPVVDVVKDGNTVKGVVISTQEGLKTITASVVIDSTGDGMIASLAGAECRIGREDGRCQPATLEFAVCDVDESRAITCWGGSDPVKMPDGEKYSDFCKRMNKAGVLPENVTIVRLHKSNKPGERNVNATQSNGFNTLTLEGILGAELDLRAQIPVTVDFLRKYVPGFENCRLKASPSTLGVRETRRIVGDYILNDNDVETGTRKEDVVVHNAWFVIDLHNPAGGGQAEGFSHPAIPYDIPYGCLLPVGLEGILTCGRCISGSHRAHGSYRVMGICMATGQAAGIAASIASKEKITPRNLDYKKIQQALLDCGVTLFE